MLRLSAAALCAALLLGPFDAAGQETALTLQAALALARSRAPALLSAHARIAEARGRLVGASVLASDNPVIESALGYRSAGVGVSSLAARLEVSQRFELGDGRGARIAAARAAVSGASAQSAEAARHILRLTALVFFRALHAQERLRIASAAGDIAAEIARIAQRRHQAGEVPRLEVILTQSALARARAEVHAADADREASLGELRVLLGRCIDEPLAVRGDLRERGRSDLGRLLARAANRPDLQVLEAELQHSLGDLRLARASIWPVIGVGAAYERDEEANIVLGIVSLTLPLFDHGQGLELEATARRGRLRMELRAARVAAGAEVEAAFDVLSRRQAAVQELEEHALPLLDENEALARRSYEAGQLGLGDLMAVRREILETRRGYLDSLLAAAHAAVELRASAGDL